MSSTSSLEAAANNAATRLGYEEGLKADQLKVVVAFLSGMDVFAVLPTGYGKSLCYGCLPFAFDQLLLNEESIILVATPLTAIMKDQVESFNRKGIKAGCISGEMSEQVKCEAMEGRYRLLFITPELLIESRYWRALLNGDLYSARLRGFVIDEAHCIAKWGDTFRKTLRRIGEVRSILPGRVNIMAVTATASIDLRHALTNIIGMHKPYVISRSPCKKNIIYSVGKFIGIEETFNPLLTTLINKKVHMPRVIIYCRSYEICSDIYKFFYYGLKHNFTHPPHAPNITRFRLVDMYTSIVDKPIREEILQLFTSNSQLRIVVATVAFGMGIDCRDVRQVIHVGAPDDVEEYIQETGRAGRDGSPCMVTLLIHKPRKDLISKRMLEYLKNETVCRRDILFRDMEGYVHSDNGIKCFCCDVCGQQCECGECDVKKSQFVVL